MSDGGYFSTLGARVAEMAMPMQPTPMPERLALDPSEGVTPVRTEAAHPETPTPDAADNVTPNPDTPLHEVAQSASPPAVQDLAQDQIAPLLQPDPLRGIEAGPDISQNDQHADPEPETVAPEPVASQPIDPPPAENARVQNPSFEADFDPPRTDALDDAPQDDMSPEDHLAVFEGFLDGLYDHPPDTAQTVAPAMDPPREVATPHVEPAATTQEQPHTAPRSDPTAPEPPEQQPQLNIGEIIVTVADPAPVPSLTPPPARRRMVSKPRRRLGHGLTAL